MKRTIFLMLLVLVLSGCNANKLQFIGDTDYLPMDKTCTTDAECVDYVNSNGGDGAPARCIEKQCMYPVQMDIPVGG